MWCTVFPPFDLGRLLNTVFQPRPEDRFCILIDLANPVDIKAFKFLDDPSLTIQKLAHEHFYQGLRQLDLQGGEMFAYQITGGSNLDLPEDVYATDGRRLSLVNDVYANYDVILCISTYSATAPLTAAAKTHGFRGATLHGLNEIILRSGLAVDYEQVSREAEKLRQGMSRADAVEIDFRVKGEDFSLRLELGRQEAQKSHGLCREGPDVANLPAGEVYYVPTGGAGEFPLKLEDGTLAILTVEDGRAVDARLAEGEAATVAHYRERLQSDPATGILGELGFGTQNLPVSGQDIQDEKIFGTFHVATGRNDHLGGDVTPDKFHEARNASHDDILFSPEKTPEIEVPQVRLYKDGAVHVLFENYQTGDYLKNLLHGQPV